MKNSIFLFIIVSLLSTSCKKEINGCTDSVATNYNSDATNDNGSCQYIWGCTDVSATNYNSSATKDDGSCQYAPTDGDVIFYLVHYPNSYYGSGVDVWLDWQTSESNYLGKLDMIALNPPLCGSVWGINYSDAISSYHTYHAVLDGMPSRTWDGGFAINTDNCQYIGFSNQ